MRANGPADVRFNPHIFIAATVLLILSACSGGGGEAGSAFLTGDAGGAEGIVSGSGGDGLCGGPWVDPAVDCGGSGGGTLTTRPTCGNDDQVGIVDACGVAITAVDLHDPVAMSLTGLTPNTRHIITIADPTPVNITPGPAAQFIATSDSDGRINKTTIVENMNPAATLGVYTVDVAKEATPATIEQSLTYTVEDRSRVQCVDGGSTPQASFLTSENVYAEVTANAGSLADGTYDVYVLNDTGSAMASGLSMGSTALTVTVAAGTGTVDLGMYASGAYDVVVDVNGNGVFNQGTDLISRHFRLHPCFAIQAASAATVNVEQIASDKNGNKREIFDPNANITPIRDIQAALLPAKRSVVQQPGSVRTYLVSHLDDWFGGEGLVQADPTSGFKIGPVQDFSNSEAPWLLTPFANMSALGGTTCYDVVIDTNGNGVFDAGTDYVDNVNHLGDNTDCGVRISTASCTNVSITSHTDGTYFPTETAITLAGIIANTPNKAYLTITSGTQSNTIEITPDGAGNYSVDLPLFAGSNYITVSGIYADNSSCSRTITLERPTNVALFRAQLTWEQNAANDYDMDLHLVKPSGIYSNGGGGDGTDCNYGNCKVGLNGELAPNDVDWGVTGEELDDPSLDVDCISGCNRIENIWMTNISEDGVYKVYVDAWNAGDIGENVTVSIYILGTRVAQVNCGHMESGTVEDTCYVGNISWTGGSAGLGTFTPVNTKATDY